MSLIGMQKWTHLRDALRINTLTNQLTYTFCEYFWWIWLLVHFIQKISWNWYFPLQNWQYTSWKVNFHRFFFKCMRTQQPNPVKNCRNMLCCMPTKKTTSRGLPYENKNLTNACFVLYQWTVNLVYKLLKVTVWREYPN